MRHRLTFPLPPPVSSPPLTAAQLAAGMDQPVAPAQLPADPRPWLSARVAACRSCNHVAAGGSTCAACDIRCAHPDAGDRQPLLANPESECPEHRWP